MQPLTRVSRLAVTDGLVVGRVEETCVREGVTAGLRPGTRTLPAGDVHAHHWVAVVSVQTPLATVPGGVVHAVDAHAGLGLAGGGLLVALAGLAVGEVPESALALVAAAAAGVLHAVALAVRLATEGVQRSLVVALAGWLVGGINMLG